MPAFSVVLFKIPLFLQCFDPLAPLLVLHQFPTPELRVRKNRDHAYPVYGLRDGTEERAMHIWEMNERDAQPLFLGCTARDLSRFPTTHPWYPVAVAGRRQGLGQLPGTSLTVFSFLPS